MRDLVRDDGLAEELTSDVMVEVWRSAGKYGGRSRARTWVFGIAHHKAIDALRKRRAALVPLDELLGAARAAKAPKTRRCAPTTGAGSTRRWRSLSAEHRAVLELTYVEGFSQKEIAEIVGCPVATMKTRAFYAKQRLRDALATAEKPQ